jgi:hypothetical protein
LWKINSFSLEAIWICHILHYWNSFCSLLSWIFFSRAFALRKPATNPLPSQKHTQGMMGVPHITDSRKLSWSFH